jgi:hypothetical protein
MPQTEGRGGRALALNRNGALVEHIGRPCCRNPSLSGGAPQSVPKILAPAFEKATGHTVVFAFQIVGQTIASNL